MTLTDYLTNIADAIRQKTGTTDSIPAMEFVEKIKNITTSESSLGKEYDTGIYTSDSTISLARSKYAYGRLPINHSLGRAPKFVYFGYSRDVNPDMDTNYVPQSNAYQFCFGLVPTLIDGNRKQVCQYAARSYNTTGGLTAGSTGSDTDLPIITADEEYFYIHGVDSTGAKIFSGINYLWVVF